MGVAAVEMKLWRNINKYSWSLRLFFVLFLKTARCTYIGAQKYIIKETQSVKFSFVILVCASKTLPRCAMRHTLQHTAAYCNILL